MNLIYNFKACNEGGTTVYNNETFPGTTTARSSIVNVWAGGLYQWGNNQEISYITPDINQISVSIINSGYNGNDTFIYDSDNWNTFGTQSVIDNMWGDITDTDLSRKGPCPLNYHIPSSNEWNDLLLLKWDASNANLGTDMAYDLKMSMGGLRNGINAIMNAQNNGGHYASTTTYNVDPNYVYMMYFNPTYILAKNIAARSSGLSIRCFKN